VAFETLEIYNIGKQSSAFTTPFQPRDYNSKKFIFHFSKEYLDERKITNRLSEENASTGSEE